MIYQYFTNYKENTDEILQTILKSRTILSAEV